MIRPSEEYARDAAETTIGDGETVALLLHGLGGDRHQPLGLVGAEPVDGLTIVAPDQRGHGETDVIGAPDDFRVERLADDASALLAHRGLAERPLIVMGISMGAAVALRLLQRDEHDLRGGVLIRPAFETEPWPDHLRVFQDVAGALRTSGPGGFEGFLASPRYREVAARSEACAKSLREQFTKPRALERVVRLEERPGEPLDHVGRHVGAPLPRDGRRRAARSHPSVEHGPALARADRRRRSGAGAVARSRTGEMGPRDAPDAGRPPAPLGALSRPRLAGVATGSTPCFRCT